MKRLLSLLFICALICACEDKNNIITIPEGYGDDTTTVEWEPEARFSVTHNSNGDVTFRDGCKGIKITYDFGDGWCNDYYPEKGTLTLQGDARYIKHKYEKKMNYTVTVTSYNNKGKSAKYSQDIKVQ